jgi:hypothetical protein
MHFLIHQRFVSEGSGNEDYHRVREREREKNELFWRLLLRMTTKTKKLEMFNWKAPKKFLHSI